MVYPNNLPIGAYFIHTPDSIVVNGSGAVTSWADVSGNNRNIATINANARKSIQKGINGIELFNTTDYLYQYGIASYNPKYFTFVQIVQCRDDYATNSYDHLFYMRNVSASQIFGIFANDTLLRVTGAGSTNLDVAGTYKSGNMLLIIYRYAVGAGSIIVNNTSNIYTITANSPPSYVYESFQFIDKDTSTNPRWIWNFQGFWNRNLTDAECLQVSNYAYGLTGGRVGNVPVSAVSYKPVLNLPSGPLFVHTPDSLVANSTGVVTSWNDISGNSLHSLPIGGTAKISDQNGIQGLEPKASSQFRKSTTINPRTGTTVVIAQRNCATTLSGSNYLAYFSNAGANPVNVVYATNTQYAFNYSGSTITTGTSNANLGGYLFIIARHYDGYVDYFINNTSTNVSITRTSTPNYINELYYFYDVNDNSQQTGFIQNFKAYWNRKLTDDECLQVSNYAYGLTSGAVGDNPNYLKNNTLPSNALYIHTPDSLQLNPNGTIVSWNDISGNKNNCAAVTSGSLTISNQNSISGLLPAVSSDIRHILTINPTSFTVAFLVQKNSNFTDIPSNNTISYIKNVANTVVFPIYIGSSNIYINYPGSTSINFANPSSNGGNFLMMIVRYNAGDCNYYINNCSVNTSITKTSTPSLISESYNMYEVVSNSSSANTIRNFSAYWNRNLTDAECLQVSNYAYNISNGMVGDKPSNTALLNKYSLDLGAI